MALTAYAQDQTEETTNQVVVETVDHVERSIVPDDVNKTSFQGISATINKAPTDQVVLSADGQTFSLLDASGNVLLSSSNPKVGLGDRIVDAKFVVEGDKMIATPLSMLRGPRCASVFWGGIIFNVGMTGMCAALAVGTVVGGVVYTAALIAASQSINWNKNC